MLAAREKDLYLGLTTLSDAVAEILCTHKDERLDLCNPAELSDTAAARMVFALTTSLASVRFPRDQRSRTARSSSDRSTRGATRMRSPFQIESQVSPVTRSHHIMFARNESLHEVARCDYQCSDSGLVVNSIHGDLSSVGKSRQPCVTSAVLSAGKGLKGGSRPARRRTAVAVR